MNTIVQGDNLRAMATLADGCAALVYMDPPFNTGHDFLWNISRQLSDVGPDRRQHNG